VLTAGAVPGAGQTTSSAPTNSLELQQVKPNLYLLTGGGGNSLAFVTDLGVVLIDTKQSGQGPAIAQRLKSVTSKPVTTIINTHAHLDHVGGNEAFGGAVQIVAQENARASMERMPAFAGAKVNALPKSTFKERTTIGAGKDRVDLYYFGAGHTGGDVFVVLPTLGVLYCGDMFPERALPVIDVKGGGSGVAYPVTLAAAVARIKGANVVITGHDGLLSWKDFEDYVRFVRFFRDYVVTGFNRGLSIGEVSEGWKTPEQYRDYASPTERVRADVEVIFGDLTK
jgi:glyoxylase-like metal-dependent hydrolase (beta-lactamase superfamily II)